MIVMDDMVSLPDKVWEFDEVIVRAKMLDARNMLSAYNRFIERELLKHGEVAIHDRWLGNISHWQIPFPGVYNPETGQVW